MGKQIEITAVFDDDSKRFHRFIIREAEGIAGTIYVSKDSQVPDVVTVKLRTRARADAEKKEQNED